MAIAQTVEQLLQNYSLAASVNPSVLVQEIIQGADTDKRVYLSCYDSDSRRIAHAMFRELRCDPVGFGPASISEPVVDQETDEICDRFLRSIGYVGICEIEMKRDSRDGRVKLIEANPRLSGGGDAAPYAGVDLCWLHYLDAIGQRVMPVAPSAVDFRHVVLRADGRALPAYCASRTRVVARRVPFLSSAAEVLRSRRQGLAVLAGDTLCCGEGARDGHLHAGRIMIRQAASRGRVGQFETIVLENRHIRVTVIPELGGRIWQIEDRARGREWIWHRESVPLSKSAVGDKYDDVWAGGWEELFPNDAPGHLKDGTCLIMVSGGRWRGTSSKRRTILSVSLDSPQ